VVIGGTTTSNADIIFTSNGSAVFNEQGGVNTLRAETNNLAGGLVVGHIGSPAPEILIGADVTGAAGLAAEARGSDVLVVISGSTPSRDTTTRGTTLNSGDFVASGSITSLGISGGAISGSITQTKEGLSYLVAAGGMSITTGSNGQITIDGSGVPEASNSVVLKSTASYLKYYSFNNASGAGTGTRYMPSHGSTAMQSALNDQATWIAPYSGSIHKMMVEIQSTNSSAIISFYKNQNATAIGHFTGSIAGNLVYEFNINGSTQTDKTNLVPNALTYSGSYDFDPGDQISFGYEVPTGGGTAPGITNITMMLLYNLTVDL